MTLRLPRLPAARVPQISIALSLVIAALALVGSSANAQAPKPAITATPAPAVTGSTPRVTEAYTAWDDYYFYAAFQVTDTNVISTNRTPTSNPQQDDDIEVFFETDGPEKATVRTDKTYQMAVSAGNGAYFSQGNGTATPTAKLVLTYKFAASVDGTLNRVEDKDTGYTIELAIPWTELGMGNNPPAPGTTWGFNVISRDRSSLDSPADKLASLSPLVQTAADVQDPSKWTKIEFVSTIASMHSTDDIVYCPHVTAQYPVIDGVISSGEWNEADGFSFGTSMIAAPAPTEAEEPNISTSPFASAAATPPASTIKQSPASNPGYDILLPGGGTIHVGKIPNPSAPTTTVLVPPEQYTPPKHGKHGKGIPPTQVAQQPAQELPGQVPNPLTPKGIGPLVAPVGPSIDTTQSLPLVDETRVMQLVMAPFVMNGTPADRDADWIDQPMGGEGSWFGGLQVGWDIEQARDARRAGVDVLLPVFDPSDPQAGAQLDTLVEALKEMRADGEDYPLLGLRTSSLDEKTATQFFNHVPDDLLAQIALPDAEGNDAAAIAVADSLPAVAVTGGVPGYVDNIDRHPVIMTTPAGMAGLKIATVSPGGKADGKIAGRGLAQTYQTSWQNAIGEDPDWVMIDSWNDYKDGTEVAASRQYGEQYADLTKVETLSWTGGQQWYAKYLSNTCPKEIAPDTLYTVTVRLENAGSLPWRVGEGYSLCYRWYKDGRLYDDSAPRIPLTTDIYPGQSATVGVGVLAQNAYGGDIEPGDYVLVFDIVQGQNRWFSYAGDNPLKVHVRVLSRTDTVPGYVIRTLATSTPTFMQTGGTYQVTAIVRNEGSETWKAGTDIVAGELQKADNAIHAETVFGKSALTADVAPGSIAYVSVPVKITDSADETVRIGWAVQPAGTSGIADGDLAHTDRVSLVPHDNGVQFALSDFSRHVRTGDKTPAQLGIENLGPSTWPAGEYKVGYHWAYLDGTPAGDGTILTPITTSVAPGRGATITTNFVAPDYPGRYNLVWDVKLPDGHWASETSASHEGSQLVAQVWVVGDHDAKAVQVDLSKDFNANGIGFETDQADANFDGKGNSIPGEMIPPDGSSEVGGNPVLVGLPGPNLYPSGYYCGDASEHRISFLYPSKRGNDMIACQGQTIDLPDGRYTSLHLLATAASSTGADFGLNYGEGTQPATVQLTSWNTRETDQGTSEAAPVGSAAFAAPYTLGPNGINASAPCTLDDYTITLDTGKRLKSLTLPNNPAIKIVAITLEK